MTKKIRVLLADDHHMMREGLASILKASGEIDVVAQASDGLEVLALLKQQAIDLVILDYSMPRLDGFVTLERIKKQFPGCKVIMLTMHEHVEYAVRSLEAGANGYLLKSGAVLELIDAVKAVAAGEVYVSAAIKEALAGALHGRTRSVGGMERLSPREFEMLRLLAKGLRISDCAREMGVSESSASTYRRRIMQKLNINTLGELVRYAVEQGIEG